MKTRVGMLLIGGAILLWPVAARAQAVAAEADFTIGRSTAEVNAAALQLRLFGEKAGWKFFAEGAWGLVAGPTSDAFGAAYPYDRRLRPIEAYTERMFRPGGALMGIRAGQYRTPFGISGRSDHAYAGFLRAPLIRYGQNWALSNNFLEAGVDVLVGKPSYYVETSLGVPADVGQTRRTRGLDLVVRGQAYVRSVTVGVSTMRTNPSDTRSFVKGRMIFHGVDARWMRAGVQIRGEWIVGRPFDGVATRGGYLDALVHHAVMGPVTAVARIERLDYDAGKFSEYYRRFTVGSRIRVTRSISGQVNFLWQPGGFDGYVRGAFDMGLTFSRRF